MDTVTIDDFAKLDLRVATILEAALHPSADKLLVLQVDLGDEKRQIVAGIKAYYNVEKLPGMQIVIVANLEPRALRGVTSHGMLLAAKHGEDLGLVTLERPVKEGSKVG